MKILTMIDSINILGRVEAVLGSLWYARRKSKRHPKQPGGMAEIRASRYQPTSGVEMERLLKHYGIFVWGGRADSDDFIFYIKESQRKWALSILKGRGIDITGGDRVEAKATQPSHAWGDGDASAIPQTQKAPPQPDKQPKKKRGVLQW